MKCRQMRWRVAAVLTLLACPALVAAEQDYWTLPDKAACRAALAPALVEKFLWPLEGHLSTTGVVAFLAGYSFRDATLLACYSQMPDDQAWSLSAPLVGIWGIVRPEFRHLIVADLHSLHGGDHQAVHRRRTRLAALVTQALANRAPAWQVGFLIHAMGDSYAHVKGPAGDLEAYGPGVGHIFAFREAPDDISSDDNITHYRDYANALYAALGGKPSQRAALDDFLRKVSVAAATHERARVVKAINDYKLVLRPGGAGESRLAGPARATVTIAEAQAFLRKVRQELE